MFEYVKIYVKACVEGPCVAKEDFPQTGISIVMTKAQPNIFTKDRDTVINYTIDVTDVYSIDPLIRTVSSRYFYESEINLRDFGFDIFNFYEDYIVKFFEISYITDTTRRNRADAQPEDTEYLSLYLRADSMSKLYKREDYQLLDYLGDLGGILDFVIVFCWALSHVFV